MRERDRRLAEPRSSRSRSRRARSGTPFDARTSTRATSSQSYEPLVRRRADRPAATTTGRAGPQAGRRRRLRRSRPPPDARRRPRRRSSPCRPRRRAAPLRRLSRRSSGRSLRRRRSSCSRSSLCASRSPGRRTRRSCRARRAIRDGDPVWAWVFLGVRVRRLARVRGSASALARRVAPALGVVAVLAAAIQLVPLAAPLLISTDAWTYWDYGRIAAVHDANPYRDPPADFPDDPAFPYVGDGLARHDVGLRACLHARFGAARARGGLRPPTPPPGSTSRWRPLAMLAAAGLAVRAGSRTACFALRVRRLESGAGAPRRRRRPQRRVDGGARARRARAGGRAGGGQRGGRGVGRRGARQVGAAALPAAARCSRRGRPGAALATSASRPRSSLVALLATWRYGLGVAAGVRPARARMRARRRAMRCRTGSQELGVPQRGSRAACSRARSSSPTRWLLRRGAARAARGSALAAGLLLLATPWLAAWYTAWSSRSRPPRRIAPRSGSRSRCARTCSRRRSPSEPGRGTLPLGSTSLS